jgi:hypothetical protein
VALNTITITPLITIFFYREALPGNWNEDFDSFQKMIILKCLRPDKVTDAMQDYVSENLESNYHTIRTAPDRYPDCIISQYTSFDLREFI